MEMVLLIRDILRRREAEELVCVLCEASTTCRDGIGGVGYQIMSRGAMVKHRTFSVSRQFVLVSYVDLCVLECLGDLRVCV